VKLPSKKFLVVMTTLGCGFVLSVLGKLTGDFATIVSIAVGSYMAAQGAVDFKNGKKPPDGAPVG
jgi:hypothetical protein